MEKLLSRDKALVDDFNNFIPPNFQIIVSSSCFATSSADFQKQNYDSAFEYLRQVKAEAPRIYPQFLNALKNYQNGTYNWNRVNREVEEYMKDYPQLARKFKNFIPKLAPEEQPKPKP